MPRPSRQFALFQVSVIRLKPGGKQVEANIVDSDDSEPAKDDDFFALSHLFSLSELNYVDIARKEKIPQLMSRWPLLAELAQYSESGAETK
ncbi:hypothetical protein IV431_09475 [Rahnella victoriana]|uniref:Cellulose biosynthesis protein BcsR n=1 Tax=Rahnella victoriana TaxID=1510570 RepID=A0ABS0DT22_9GAMM|nr:hypothetical protein [Rahnella victoriana]